MDNKVPIIGLLLLCLVSFVLFRTFQHEVIQAWFEWAIHPEVRAILDDAGQDLRTLARVQPAEASAYRDRFERIQEARKSLNILAHNRHNLTRRYQGLLLLGFAIVTLGWLSAFFWNRQRLKHRLEGLYEPLGQLARGEVRIFVADRRKDTLGAIGRMIERTARRMAGQREKLDYMAYLAEWEQTARNLAHEIRTPLATMKMELERIPRVAGAVPPAVSQRIEAAVASSLEEIERLSRFVKGFNSMTGLGEPSVTRQDLTAYLTHFGELFSSAWPNVSLAVKTLDTSIFVDMDKGMIRQVLMNLCNNSAQALEGRTDGSIVITQRVEPMGRFVDVEDNGPGIDKQHRQRIFEPFVTGHAPGKGRGLGLAIARKIMLQHGGDLCLKTTSSRGTCFRLILPAQESLVSAVLTDLNHDPGPLDSKENAGDEIEGSTKERP